MAKKVSVKGDLAKKSVEKPKKSSSVKVDTTMEGILERKAVRELLPSVAYVNSYLVKDRGKEWYKTVDLTDLVDKYPQSKTLIEQLIVGLNAITFSGHSSSTVKTNVGGVRCFVDFINSPLNLSNCYVVDIADISTLVAQSFTNYLLSVYPKDGRRRKWFGAIKRIVQKLQKLYRNNPQIKNNYPWPASPKAIESPKQGYLPREMKELIEACISDIEEIKDFHKAYKVLDLDHQELFLEEWNLENLMYYLHERLQNKETRRKQGFTERGWIKKILNKNPLARSFIDENGFTSEKIQDLYFEKGLELTEYGRDPFPTKISNVPDLERAKTQFNLALVSIKKHYSSFPYYCPLDEARMLFSRHQFNSGKPLSKMVCRAVNYSASKIEFMNGTLGTSAVFAAMHFVTDTIYPFLVLSLINTGWNLESILSIGEDIDEYTTPDLFDPENYVIIIGTKNKGQKKEAKAVYHRSPKNKVWGTYALLKYVQSVITKYKDSPYYQKGYLWQFTFENLPTTRDKLIGSLNESPKAINEISRRFVKRHGFECFSDRAVDHPSIRSGYAALRQLMGATERKISEDLGHNDEETLIHYISDESSNMVIDIKIKQLQKQFVDDLRNYKVPTVESQSLEKLRQAIIDARTQQEKEKQVKEQAEKTGLKESVILHLLDVGSQKYILACQNAKKPSWPGYDAYVKEGQNCRYFNKCALCKQAVVFPEALPFIARRIMDLEKLQSGLTSTDWILQYGDEQGAWKQILDIWNNEVQVKEAWEQARAGFVTLPQNMRGV